MPACTVSGLEGPMSIQHFYAAVAAEVIFAAELEAWASAVCSCLLCDAWQGCREECRLWSLHLKPTLCLVKTAFMCALFESDCLGWQCTDSPARMC